MKKNLFFLFILFSAAAAAQWQQTNGPAGETVNAFGVNGNSIFAGTVQSGIYRSDNNGQSWVAKNNGIENLFISSVQAFAVKGNLIFAGILDGVYLSSNNGESWIAVNNGLPENSWVTSFAVSGNNIFVGLNNGVGDNFFLSANSGQSWTPASNGLGETGVLSMAASGNAIYAGTWEGFFRSTDGGTNWTRKTTGTITFITISGSNIFAGGASVNISTDNGDHWTPVNTGLPNAAIRCLTINGTNIFAGTDAGVYRSTNNGGNWTSVNTGLTAPWIISLAVKGNTVFAGNFGGGGIYTSGNNGASWNEANQGLPSIYINSIVTNGSIVYAATLRGLYASSDKGSNWSRIHISAARGYDIRGLFIHNGDLFAFNSYGIYFSPDNGITWNVRSTGLTNTYIKQIIADGTDLFASTQSGEPGAVYFSSDNGNSWMPKNNGLTNTNIFELLLNSNKLFAGTDSGLFVSANKANSWTRITNGLPPHRISFVGAISGNKLLATDGLGGGITYFSNDNGNSWQPISTLNNGLPGTGNTRVWSLVANGNKIYAGTSAGVYLSDNGGVCWTAVNEGFTTGINNLSTLASDATRLYTAANNVTQGIWYRPLSEFVSGCGTLPSVTILNFKGRSEGSKNILTWQTATEQNTSYFTVERSATSGNFSSIGKVNAAGNSNSQRNYNFTDNNPLKGDNYYRLKLVLKNGNTTYSEIIKLAGAQACVISVSPNPARCGDNITITCIPDCTKIQLLNTGGCMIKQWINPAVKGNVTIRLPYVSKGVYYLKCISKKETKVIKLVIH